MAGPEQEAHEQQVEEEREQAELALENDEFADPDNPPFEGEEAEEAEEAPEPVVEEEEKLTFNDKQQEFINGKIGELTKKERKAIQHAEQIERENQELREKLGANQPPEIPPPVDPYDPEYAAKVVERDEAIKQYASWEQQQVAAQQAQVQAQQQALLAQQQRIQETVTNYSQRAEKLGINAADLGAAGNLVNSTGVPNEIAEHILNDPNGPQITIHLARNLAEMDVINSMTPTQAAIYIEQNIKPAATASMKKADPPPAPVEHLRGKGEVERQPGPKGATYR